MKLTLTTLLAAAGLFASPLFAQEKPQLVTFEQLLTSPDQYQAKTVALHGTVARVSAERKMFTMVDTSEAACADGCNAPTVMAALQAKGPIALPKPGQEAVVVGQIDQKNGRPILEVTQVVTSPDQMKQLQSQASRPETAVAN